MTGGTDASAAAALVRRWFAGFAVGLPEFEELVDPDVVNHAAPPPLQRGRENFRRVLDAVLAAAGADGGYDVRRIGRSPRPRRTSSGSPRGG